MSNHSTIAVTAVSESDNGGIQVDYIFNNEPQVFTLTYSSKQSMIDLASDPMDASFKAIPLALAWWARRDPNFSDPSYLVGKLVTIDFGAVVPIKVTNLDVGGVKV